MISKQTIPKIRGLLGGEIISGIDVVAPKDIGMHPQSAGFTYPSEYFAGLGVAVMSQWLDDFSPNYRIFGQFIVFSGRNSRISIKNPLNSLFVKPLKSV